MNHPARIFTIISMLCAAFSLGCASNPVEPSQLPLGRPFELRPGASETLRGGLTITFGRVNSDSRCPMDVVCVWAGDASLSVSLSHAAGGPAERELHTDPTRAETLYLSYSIKLVALAPYPRSDGQIRPEDYVATLVVAAR